MADDITVLDASNLSKTVGTKERAGARHLQVWIPEGSETVTLKASLDAITAAVNLNHLGVDAATTAIYAQTTAIVGSAATNAAIGTLIGTVNANGAAVNTTTDAVRAAVVALQAALVARVATLNIGGGTPVHLQTSSLSAATPTTDGVSVAQISGTIVIGTTAYTVKKMFATLTGTQSTILAVTSKRQRVIALSFSPSAAGTITINGAAGSDPIGGFEFGGAGQTHTLGVNPHGWFQEQATAGQVLQTVVSSGTVKAMLSYIEV